MRFKKRCHWLWASHWWNWLTFETSFHIFRFSDFRIDDVWETWHRSILNNGTLLHIAFVTFAIRRETGIYFQWPRHAPTWTAGCCAKKPNGQTNKESTNDTKKKRERTKNTTRKHGNNKKTKREKTKQTNIRKRANGRTNGQTQKYKTMTKWQTNGPNDRLRSLKFNMQNPRIRCMYVFTLLFEFFVSACHRTSRKIDSKSACWCTTIKHLTTN